MITLLVKFNVKPEQVDSFRALLIADRDGARTEKGCQLFELYSQNEEPTVLYAFERWDSQAALDNHAQQHYTKNVFKAVENALQPPLQVWSLGVTDQAPLLDVAPPPPDDETVIIFFMMKIKEEMRAQVIEEFPRQVTRTRREPDNQLFELYTVDGEEDLFVVYEQWKNKTALDEHFKTPYSKQMGALLLNALPAPPPETMNFVTQIA